MLHRIRHGAPTDRPPLLIAHGLFGSARNWGVVARRLSDAREVVSVDMRNHGASPWSDDHSYAAMAGDLAETIGDVPHDVLGHSLTALSIKVELASRLIEVDPARAKAELESIQETARLALAEVRSTVGGLRAANLEAEPSRAAQFQGLGCALALPGRGTAALGGAAGSRAGGELFLQVQGQGLG